MMNATRKSCSKSLMILLTVFYGMVALPVHAQQNATDAAENPSSATNEDFYDLAIRTLIGSDEQRKAALKFWVDRGDLDIVPTLVLIMRIGGSHVDVQAALKQLTGDEMPDWRAAMLWQEAHPEIIPHQSYYALKLRYFYNIDLNFAQFFEPQYLERDRMKIRFEEITWGGVKVGGIPSLDNPQMIDAKDATYLKGSDLVFGVEINGDVRAYPLRIMGWHEMFNDVIGGVPVALAYCTLCGSGILFETDVEGRDTPFVFGSSGFLYRSNKLMFDHQTNSLWNQFTGKPVVGPLVDEDISLKIRPVTINSWSNWSQKHPQTKVLSLETGHFRNYDSGVVYQDYFASPDLMFPAIVRDESVVKRKDYVFGIREFNAAKAWPVKAFQDQRIINDEIGTTPLVLIGDALTRTVRAYERGDEIFQSGDHIDQINSGSGQWTIEEDFLIGPDGKKLPRVPGHISYWFAWDGYLGNESQLYQ